MNIYISILLFIETRLQSIETHLNEMKEPQQQNYETKRKYFKYATYTHSFH